MNSFGPAPKGLLYCLLICLIGCQPVTRSTSNEQSSSHSSASVLTILPDTGLALALPKRAVLEPVTLSQNGMDFLWQISSKSDEEFMKELHTDAGRYFRILSGKPINWDKDIVSWIQQTCGPDIKYRMYRTATLENGALLYEFQMFCEGHRMFALQKAGEIYPFLIKQDTDDRDAAWEMFTTVQFTQK